MRHLRQVGITIDTPKKKDFRSFDPSRQKKHLRSFRLFLMLSSLRRFVLAWGTHRNNLILLSFWYLPGVHGSKGPTVTACKCVSFLKLWNWNGSVCTVRIVANHHNVSRYRAYRIKGIHTRGRGVKHVIYEQARIEGSKLYTVQYEHTNVNIRMLTLKQCANCCPDYSNARNYMPVIKYMIKYTMRFFGR